MFRWMLVCLAMSLWVTGAAAQEFPSKSPDKDLTQSPQPPAGASMGGGGEIADLTPGDSAPSFTLDSSTGHPVSLADLKGRWAVLLFAPGDAAFDSTAAVDDSIGALGARLFGVCEDGTDALSRFGERHGLRYPLLSDPTGQISQLFGMYDDQNEAIQDGMVVLDDHGVVRLVVQGPALRAPDVLAMVRHVRQGNRR